MSLESQSSSTDTTSSILDTTAVKHDKVFEEIVKAISPQSITAGNKAALEAFVDILAEVSPTSVNILDVFSKDVRAGNIKNVQDEFAKMYLNNFYYVWNRAKKDYILRNRLVSILNQYESLSASEGLLSDISFFDNEESLYNVERYILGKGFKEKKGTATAIEYAYRLAWLTGIEGPLRTDYLFDLQQEECIGGVSEGATICDSLSTPCSLETNSGPGKLINTFRISDEVSDDQCVPFTYKIEGSLLPELFDAFVVPLAHPVGFRYIYRKLLKMAFEDYFNIDFIYTADVVSVNSLCPDGDCSAGKLTTIATAEGGGISNSSLKTFEKGKIYSGLYTGFQYEKYIFENDDYLISYVRSSPSGDVERMVQYFDVSGLLDSNEIVNPNFRYNTGWTIPDNSAWYIDSGNQYAVLDNGLVGDKISQPVAFEAGTEYLIELNINALVGAAELNLGSWQKYDDNGNILVGQFDEVKYSLTENLTYTINYVARGGEIFEVLATEIGTSLKLDNILVTKYIPALDFPEETHSSITLDNPSVPIPVLHTSEEIDEWYVDTIPGDVDYDNMNDLYYLNSGDLTPLVGDLVVNEFYYGESTYTTTGAIQIVTVGRSETVDYKIESGSTGVGTLETRYEALDNLGSLDLDTVDFTDTVYWKVSIVDMSPGDPDVDNTNEGGFIIGGYVIPWGDPDTAYMYDSFLIEVPVEEPWVNSFASDNFNVPEDWNVGDAWTIVLGGSPEANTASFTRIPALDPVLLIPDYNILSRAIDNIPIVGHFIKVSVSCTMLPEDINWGDSWFEITIGSSSPYRYYDSGTKEILIPYDGTPLISIKASDNFEGVINNVYSISQ